MAAAAGSVRTMALEDAHGRQMGDLRISITDRCNFRCVYCMPEEGMRWIERARILTFPRSPASASVFVRLGIREVRLTGGEPTVRPDLPGLIRQLSALARVRESLP